MHTLRHFLLTALLGVSTVCTLNQPVHAGRLGGAIADIPFAAGEPAVVSVIGTGTANVDLALHDGDGNTALGLGFTDRKTATMHVYREGLFRVEVRNLSPTTSTVMLRTN